MDKDFRKKVENAQSEVPDYLWQKIQNHPDVKRVRLKRNAIKFAAPALVAVTALSAFLIYQTQNNQTATVAQATETTSPALNVTPTETISSTSEISNNNTPQATPTPTAEPAENETQSSNETKLVDVIIDDRVFAENKSEPELVEIVCEFSSKEDEYDVLEELDVEPFIMPNPEVIAKETAPQQKEPTTKKTETSAPEKNLKSIASKAEKERLKVPKQEEVEITSITNMEELTSEVEAPVETENFKSTSGFKSAESDGIYIPNAFNPLSPYGNEVFRVITEKELADFALTILDRTGNIAFQTRNISEGWDGTVNGEVAQMGVYIYILSYKENNKNIRKKGIVTLLR